MYDTIQCVNEIQAKIATLENNGWTLAAIADELAISHNAVEKWKAGDRYPRNVKAVLIVVDQLVKRKRIPKQRRY